MVKADKGDLIRVVSLNDGKGNEVAFGNRYKVGDILEVDYVDEYEKDDVTVTTNDCYLFDSEYEIFRKAGEEDEVDVVYESYIRTYDEPQPVTTDANATQDAVNHPNHYRQGRFETIEIIEEITQGYEDGYVAYCVGNALKYLARAPFKHGEPTEDIAKAAKYLEFAIKRLG